MKSEILSLVKYNLFGMQGMDFVAGEKQALFLIRSLYWHFQTGVQIQKNCMAAPAEAKPYSFSGLK